MNQSIINLLKIIRLIVVTVFFFPFFLIGLLINEFAEWWHFGPAQRLLHFARYIGPDWDSFKKIYNYKRAWVFISKSNKKNED
jgi:hypothetical protein